MHCMHVFQGDGVFVQTLQVFEQTWRNVFTHTQAPKKKVSYVGHPKEMLSALCFCAVFTV